MTSQNLANKVMLVSLNISMYSARKYDKTATEQVRTDFNVSEGSARVNKVLIAKEALKEMTSIADAARTFHYANTAPWIRKGADILTAKNYMHYSTKIRELKDLYFAAVQNFLENYADYKEAAKKDLGSLWKEDDYPTPANLKHRFDFQTSVEPLPTAEDFRVSLQSEEVEQIQKDIAARLEEAQKAAMADLWDRLYTVVNKVVERLSDADNKFHDSLIGNVAELVDILPRINVTDDPRLNRMVKLVEEKLCTVDPSELRKDNDQRKETCKDAKDLLDVMSDYMGAF